MTPAELREYAQVMRTEGVFKFTHISSAGGETTIELSQAAIAAAQAERHPQPTTIPTQPAAPPVIAEDEEDRFAFMATEG